MMDEFLSLVGVQAMRYAIRSSIAIVSTYALGQLSNLIRTADDQETFARLQMLHSLFEGKVKIISPAFDLVDLKSCRGNVFLQSAAPMTRALQGDITSLTTRLKLASQTAQDAAGQVVEKTRQAAMKEVKLITQDLQQLIDRIDREVPLLQLAITASGESLSTSLPPSISPSRLLQASTLLVVGDIQFSRDSLQSVQIGPTFCLSLYMLFQAHAPRQQFHGSATDHDRSQPDDGRAYGLGPSDRKPLWQEVMHKSQVRLFRTATSHENRLRGGELREYRYHLAIDDDPDDGRVRYDLDRGARDGLGAGLTSHEVVPMSEVSKLFYTDTGRLLNLGHDDDPGHSPVLLLKRDIGPSENELCVDKRGTENNIKCDEQADIDRQLLGETVDVGHATQALPSPSTLSSAPQLDPEWIAFEVFEEAIEGPDDSESSETGDEDEQGENQDDAGSGSCLQRSIDSRIEKLDIHTKESPFQKSSDSQKPPGSPLGAITTSLSLLEMLIRLAGLQEFQQTSHLAIPDHILSFFLEETSSTGTVGDSEEKVRAEAKNKVGFDPYVYKKE